MSNRAWKLSSIPARLFTACLLVCLGSGVLLALHYDPAGDPARSVEAITTLVPFGFFFRRLHFASGQACALLALVHTLRHFLPRSGPAFPPRAWPRLTMALATCFLLLLTGFILRGDQESALAANVLRNLAASVPLAGPALAPALAGSPGAFCLRPWLLHCLVLPVVLLVLLRGHLRLRPFRAWALAPAAVGLGLWALFVPMPPAVLAGQPLDSAHGPWFLLGMQELLRLLPPFWGGVVLPVAIVATAALLPRLADPWARAARCFLACAALGYAALTLKIGLG